MGGPGVCIHLYVRTVCVHVCEHMHVYGLCRRGTVYVRSVYPRVCVVYTSVWYVYGRRLRLGRKLDLLRLPGTSLFHLQ